MKRHDTDGMAHPTVAILHDAGLILGLRPAKERRYKVTPCLIGWAQT